MGASQMQIMREGISRKGSSHTKDVMVLTLGGNIGSLLYLKCVLCMGAGSRNGS